MPDSSQQRRSFRTTRWSLIAAAARACDDPVGRDAVDADGRFPDAAADDALQHLCQAYWYPIYAFLRHSGSTRDDAADLTQGFFSQLLEKNFLADADPDRGRFRTFLLTALKNYRSNEWDRQRALKRGGDRHRLSIDFSDAETQYRIEPIDGWTAEGLFDRNWALTLLSEVLSSLQQEYDAAGKSEWFAALKPYLTAYPPAETMAEIARRLQVSPAAVKVAVHRLRQTYRERLYKEIAETLPLEVDPDAERDILFRAIQGPQAANGR